MAEMAKMAKKNKGLRTRLFFLHIGSFAASAAPLICALIINREKYFSEPSDSVKLGVGAMLALLFIALKVFGKLKVPRRIIAFGGVFVMSYLLSPLLSDLVLLSGMAFLGEGIDLVFFAGAIRKTREKILIGKAADATSDRVEELFKKYIGSGRT